MWTCFDVLDHFRCEIILCRDLENICTFGGFRCIHNVHKMTTGYSSLYVDDVQGDILEMSGGIGKIIDMSRG